MMRTRAECVEGMKDTEAVRKTLKDIQTCFSKKLPKTTWFLKCGTALAAVFGGHIIPGDNDIDIGVLAETCPPADFVKVFDKAGFTREYFFNDKEFPMLGIVIRFSKRGVPFDCYWLYPRGRKRWWLTAPRVPHVLPAYLFEDIHNVRLLGLELPAPHPIEVYCDHMYKKYEGSYPAFGKKGEPGETLEVFPEWEIK